MSWKYRVLQAIGFLMPISVGTAVIAWVDPMHTAAFDAVPLWAHLLITGVALAGTITIVAWAVRGGIPPRYRHE